MGLFVLWVDIFLHFRFLILASYGWVRLSRKRVSGEPGHCLGMKAIGEKSGVKGENRQIHARISHGIGGFSHPNTGASLCESSVIGNRESCGITLSSLGLQLSSESALRTRRWTWCPSSSQARVRELPVVQEREELDEASRQY